MRLSPPKHHQPPSFLLLQKIPETSNTYSLKIYSKHTNVGELTAVFLFPTPVAYPRHPSPSNFLRFSFAIIHRCLASSLSNFLRIGWLVILGIVKSIVGKKNSITRFEKKKRTKKTRRYTKGTLLVMYIKLGLIFYGIHH